METICLQCGDKGFTNAFVYCVKCLDFALHRYCLNVPPKTLDEYVRWFCDDCEMEVKNQPVVRKCDAIRCQMGDCLEKNDVPVGKAEEPVYYEDIVRCSSDACEERIRCSPCSSQQLEKEKVKNDTMQHRNKESEVMQQRNFAPSMVDRHEFAEPIIMPIWRGSFNIGNKNYDILDGLVAHMSSRACQQVYDEASLFLPVLNLEMLAKSDVWPKSFLASEPGSENIALYFFPSDIRSERVFDHLVDEMVRKELAMRAVVQNAELLVFTSTELQMPHWRFKDKYYLWGVFVGKPHSGFGSQSFREGKSNYNPIMLEDDSNDTGSNPGANL